MNMCVCVQTKFIVTTYNLHLRIESYKIKWNWGRHTYVDVKYTMTNQRNGYECIRDEMWVYIFGQ